MVLKLPPFGFLGEAKILDRDDTGNSYSLGIPFHGEPSDLVFK